MPNLEGCWSVQALECHTGLDNVEGYWCWSWALAATPDPLEELFPSLAGKGVQYASRDHQLYDSVNTCVLVKGKRCVPALGKLLGQELAGEYSVLMDSKELFLPLPTCVVKDPLH